MALMMKHAALSFAAFLAAGVAGAGYASSTLLERSDFRRSGELTNSCGLNTALIQRGFSAPSDRSLNFMQAGALPVYTGGGDAFFDWRKRSFREGRNWDNAGWTFNNIEYTGYQRDVRLAWVDEEETYYCFAREAFRSDRHIQPLDIPKSAASGPEAIPVTSSGPGAIPGRSLPAVVLSGGGGGGGGTRTTPTVTPEPQSGPEPGPGGAPSLTPVPIPAAGALLAALMAALFLRRRPARRWVSSAAPQ